MKEKDVLLASTRAKLESLQADHSASDDTVSGLEELLLDKDKQIERFDTLPVLSCHCLTIVMLNVFKIINISKDFLENCILWIWLLES